MKNAIILCSGGLDSITLAHHLKNKLNYNKITILFFNYSQKSLKSERNCAKKCAKDIKADFREIYLPELTKLSTSLINKPGKKETSIKELRNTKDQTRVWYVPARNTVFLSYALALADNLFIKTRQKSDIFFGFKCEGNNPYPDTTMEFLDNADKIAKATESKPKIFAPLIKMDKEDIIQLAIKLNVNLKQTHSCYLSNIHCGKCLSCRLRQAGFYWANQKDNTKYKI